MSNLSPFPLTQCLIMTIFKSTREVGYLGKEFTQILEVWQCFKKRESIETSAFTGKYTGKF